MKIKLTTDFDKRINQNLEVDDGMTLGDFVDGYAQENCLDVNRLVVRVNSESKRRNYVLQYGDRVVMFPFCVLS